MSSAQKFESLKKTSSHFVIGGLSGAFATLIIQPIDTLKVQVQIISEAKGKHPSKGSFLASVIRTIYHEKGLSVLYRGLGSAIWRQIYYASARLGSYNYLVAEIHKTGAKINLTEKVGLSAVSGVIGAVVGNPFDVALVRRQASITTNKNAYSSTLHAFTSIVRQEGWTSLWRGLDITMLRVLLINTGQLAGNQIITSLIQPLFRSQELLLNTSAVLASVATAVLSLPADNIKVKLQKQTPEGLLYTGIGDCLAKTVSREGVLRLWVGFPIYLLRGMPHSFVLIRTQQFLKARLLAEE